MSPIDKQALAWLLLQAGRPLNDDERADFQAWLAQDNRHRGAYVRATVIDNAIGQASQRHALYPGEDRFGLETDETDPASTAGRRGFLKFGALAAGIAALGFGTAIYYPGDKTTFVTAKGEFRRVALADLSVANINSGSQVEVRLTEKQRDVTLKQGEAWFEVAKNKARPFVVDAGGVQVRAVGTAFGVRRYRDGAEVLVTEGTVEVWTGAAAKTLLTAGERTYVPYQTAQIAVARQPKEVERKLAWREGKLIFARQTLSEAVADFNRYSPRKIVITDPAIMNKRIFGQYQIDAPEQFARDISSYLDVPIVVTPENIIIGGERTDKDGNT